VVIPFVLVAAGQPDVVRAGLAFPAWSAGQDPAVFSRRAWTGPNDGAVRVTKTQGWSATVAGMPLPPVSPARMSW
jgi:hypothetical protein